MVVAAAAAATILAFVLVWRHTGQGAGVRDGRDVLMTDVGRTTCVPVHDTEKIVYGEALANVTDEPVEVIGAHISSTGGATLASAWLAEPDHGVGVLNYWPPPDMAKDFDTGKIKPLPAWLRSNPDRSGWDAQSLVLFIRMPAGSTISNVSVTYRKEGSSTVYRSDETTSTLRAVGAATC